MFDIEAGRIDFNMLSRLFSILIRPNHVIKLTNTKRQLWNPSRLPVLNPYPGSKQVFQFKAMSTDIEKELNDPKRHFDYKQLIEKKKADNVVLIDVREHSEIQETGKIPGSIHIPLNDLNHALNAISAEDFLKLYKSKKPQKENEIIFTCRSGRRSLTAMKLAELKSALGEMSKEEFKKKYSSERPEKDAEIIFSCKAGGRSLKALKLGLELGYNKAGNYKGGWLDWAENSKQTN